MKHAEMIAAIQAHMDGKPIQYKQRNRQKAIWQNCANYPLWDFRLTEYRVKPELIQGYINVYPDGKHGNTLHDTPTEAERYVSPVCKQVLLVEVPEDE